jgi:tripartite ATP-independent transporter DctM subunit
VYGILTQNSIGKLFLGSILTGLLLGALFVITIYILCKRNPSLGPPGPRVKFKDKVASIILLWEVIILFGLVMGGLFMGWFTPTEAAGVGAGGALVLALIKGDLTWKKFLDAGIGTVDATVMAIMLLAGTMVFSRFLAVTRIPFELSSWVGTLPLPPVFVLIAILLIYGIAGCIIESFPFFILTIPIFYPIVMRLGYDPIWYGVLITLVAIMGMITPPAGICCYIVAGIAKDVPLKAVFKGSIPFIPAFVVCAALLIAFPKIVTIIHILLP